MTNIFRQLIAPWLLALVLAWVLIIVWHYNETRNQQLQQIQQLAVTTKYAAQATLSGNNNQQLANQLRQIDYSAAPAVKYIATYDGQLQLIASSKPAEAAAVLNDAADVYQVTALPDGSQLAVLPVSTGLASSQPAVAGQNRGNGYVVVVFRNEPGGLLWLVPLALLTVALAAGLILNIGALRRGQLRLATDVELLAHYCRRLQNSQQHSQTAEPLVAVLKPLQQVINDLAATLEHKQLTTEQLVQQLNQRAQHANLQQTELEQQRQQLSTELQLQQRQLRHWFGQSMLLWQRRDQLQSGQLQRLLQMHLLAGYYQFSDKVVQGQPVQLGHWLGQHISELNEILAPTAAISLDWHEHADSLGCTVNICQRTLQSLLQALIMLCLRIEDVSKIAVTIQLQPNEQQPVLRLTASCNGNGLPAHCRELIKTDDLQELQWSDTDVALLKAIQTTGAAFNSQSLDGLGCILQLTVPVQTERHHVAKTIQHLLIFDADSERGQQRSVALNGIASQVSKCNRPAELEQLIHSKVFDIVLVFLPPTTDISDWQKLRHSLQQQPGVLYFAPPNSIASWLQTLPDVLASQQFCLSLVQKKAEQLPNPANQQHILVVDDNETNLAFVQVLLKNKPLVLHTATSAAQVFSLCAQTRFDMILLDIQLPDMSGVDIAKKLRQMPQYRQVPIVAFTAHALPAEIERYREAGMDDIVFKPLEPARLDTLLARFSLSANPG